MMEGSVSVQIITDPDPEAQKHADPDPQHSLGINMSQQPTNKFCLFINVNWSLV
jgi:hypothetical protein